MNYKRVSSPSLNPISNLSYSWKIRLRTILFGGIGIANVFPVKFDAAESYSRIATDSENQVAVAINPVFVEVIALKQEADVGRIGLSDLMMDLVD